MIPIRYSCRSMMVRWKATLTTAGTFTLVVAASVVMFAFVQGVLRVCRTSGEAENVIVLQNGINDELLSRITHDTAARLSATQGIERSEDGAPLCSRELFAVVSYRSSQTGQYYFRQVRGVESSAFGVHSNVHIARGQMFRPQLREVIVGTRLAADQEIEIGSQLDIGGQPWRVVGVFEAAGGIFETEVWCGRTMLASQLHRLGDATTVVLRSVNAAEAIRLAERLRIRFRDRIVANIETDYYEHQASQVEMLRAGAILIAALMSIGAVFSVMNTMFAAIRHRTRDIATMRMIGFSRTDILLGILFESILIAAIGGIVGCAIGLAVNGVSMSAPLGFRDLGFAFRVDSSIILYGIAMSLGLGVAGGLLPAVVAMRVAPLKAIRN